MSLNQTRLLAAEDPTDRELAQLLMQLDDLLDRLGAAESSWAEWLSAVDPRYRSSARNIVHYWAFRQEDLRELQSRLAGFGLYFLLNSANHFETSWAVNVLMLYRVSGHVIRGPRWPTIP